MGSASPPSFECPVCRRRTFNPNDITAAYCPCCGSPVEPRQCEHPRLYENTIPNPAGESGRSVWYLYRTLCQHGYMAQNVVRPLGSDIPPEAQVEAVLTNHQRVHSCRCFGPVFARYLQIMAEQRAAGPDPSRQN